MRKTYEWSHNTILEIVRDCVYVGDMENHKFEIKNYKTKKRTRVPKDQHIIVENMHEAIMTYNFEVADFHTYYVGEQGICVDNAACD